MAWLRHALGRVAALWLVCHLAALTAVPWTLSATSAQELLECTCAHGDHAICPMHHKPALGTKFCVLRSANDDSVAVLNLLFGAIGLTPVATQAVAPLATQTVVFASITTTTLRPPPPDPPPPRA
jgi:hypothetical protein